METQLQGALKTGSGGRIRTDDLKDYESSALPLGYPAKEVVLRPVPNGMEGLAVDQWIVAGFVGEHRGALQRRVVRNWNGEVDEARDAVFHADRNHFPNQWADLFVVNLFLVHGVPR